MVFYLRIVNADFYTTEPLAGLDPVYSNFRSSKVLKVPVIRIFGATPTGQKCCLHIHGVLPYIYIPYGGDEPKEAYLRQFATSVDFALHVSQGKASSSNRHVHDIEVVSGRSFYGYHEEEREFMKVYFYNPFVITRVVELLQNGAVMSKVFQPYESHIPYIQQMFIDYNLYGMNLLNTSAVIFRTPIQLKPDPDDPAINEDSVHSPISPLLSPSSYATGNSTGCHQFWTEGTVPRNSRHSLEVERLSVCELEADTKAEHIMNQFEIGTSIGTNPGLVAIWQDEQQRRKDEKDDSDLGLPISQERGYIPLLQAEQNHRERLEQILVDRNLEIQSQNQRQDCPSNSPSPNEREPSSFDINENTPLVDRSIMEEVIKSSQQSMSQEPGNCTDMQMVEILASLAQSQSQSQRMNLTLAGVTSDDEGDEDGVQDEDVSVVMSQEVWDDTDPAFNSADYNESDTNNCAKGAMDSQRSPLRMSQFDLHGLDDTWEVSLLREELIPQLDGNYDDVEDMPSKVCTLKKKSVSKRPALISRRSKLTKAGSFSNPSVSLSKVSVENSKHKAAHRLGMSSVRLTRRSTRNDVVQSHSKQYNEDFDVDTIPKHEVKFRKAKPINRIPPSCPIPPNENCCTELSQNKNTSPQFSLYLSESTSSVEDISYREDPIAKFEGCSERKAAHLISCAPQITHVSENAIPCVVTAKGRIATERKMSLSLTKTSRKAKDSNDESNIILSSNRLVSETLEQTIENEEDVCKTPFLLQSYTRSCDVTRKTNEITVTEVEAREDLKPFNIPSEQVDVTIPEKRAEQRKQDSERQSSDHKKQLMMQTKTDDQRRHKLKQQKQEKNKSVSKLHTSFKDIKKRVFAEYKPFPKKRKNENVSIQLRGKDSTEDYQSIGNTKHLQKPIDYGRHISVTLIETDRSSEIAKANTRKDAISQGKEFMYNDDVVYCRLLEYEDDNSFGLAGENATTEELLKFNNKVKDCGLSSNDKLTARVENRDCEKLIQESESNDSFNIPLQCLKVCLTDVATVQSKRHLFSAAHERWKRRKAKLNAMEEVVSQTQISTIKSIGKVTTNTRTRNPSPKTSPNGKRFGLLNVTIHSSNRLKPLKVNSTSLSPSKTVRSSTITNSGSQSPYKTSLYVSSATGSSQVPTRTFHKSPRSSRTNLQPKLQQSRPFASSPKRCKHKPLHLPKANLQRTMHIKSPKNVPTSKRNIFTKIDRSFLRNSQKLNEVDRLFDTLGWCFSKEEVTSCISSKGCREENTMKLSNLQLEREHCQDCVWIEVTGAKQTQSIEVEKTHKKLKRRRSESEIPPRKQPKLSLKLKSTISSKTENLSYIPGSGTDRKDFHCAAQKFDSIGKSSLTGESSESPSILNAETPLSRISAPGKFEANSDFCDIKNVTSSLRPSCDETHDSAGSMGSESLKSSEENYAQDSFANLSPDLFESALLKMSYLSPEHRQADFRTSPPFPSTPCNTSDADDIMDNSQIITANKKHVFRRYFDESLFGLFSPDSNSKLSGDKISKYHSEDIDLLSISSSSNVGLSQGKTSLEKLRSHRNRDQNVISSISPRSLATVNRTCTIESDECNENRSQAELVKTDALYDNGRNEMQSHGRANDKNLKNHKSLRTNSALNVLHQYCKRIQKEKDALMGIDVGPSQDSVQMYSSKDEPASVTNSSQDDVCSTRYSVISPSCSIDTTSPKENLSVDNPSLMCDNAGTPINDTSLSSSNEMSPAIDYEIQCSRNSIDIRIRSPHSISSENSIAEDLHYSNSLCKETSPAHISSVKGSRCRYDSNEDDSLILCYNEEDELNVDRSLISYEADCCMFNEGNERDGFSNANAKGLPKANGRSGAHRTDDGHHQLCQSSNLETEKSGQENRYLSKDKDIIIMPQKIAPHAETSIQSLKDLGIPRCRYQEPFYSDPSDVSDAVMDVGGRLLKVLSNQVKILPSFDTSSPFMGIQGMREILCASHETSFLDACQDNIGTADTFLGGIENNPELKIAFMGDKRLTITPCKLPPHPTVVRSWAQKKLAKKFGHTKYDNKVVKTVQNGLKSSPAGKITSSGSSDVRCVAIKSRLDDTFDIDNMSGGATSSGQKDKRLACSQKAQDSSSYTEKVNLDVFQGDSQNRDSFPLETSVCESKPDSGNGLMQPDITNPNTMFSPVNKTFSFSVETQSKIAGGSVYDPSLIKADVKKKTSLNAEEKETISAVHQGCGFALQSTPVPQKLTRNREAVSPSTKTPTSTTSLPRLPFLTPITGPTQVSSFEERSSSPSGVDARKSSNKAVVPIRHLIISQLKFLTPENVLRRHISEAGSEIEGPSPINSAGYKVPQLNIQDAKASHEVQHLTLLSIELHVRTRKDRKPDPEFDPICALFFHVQTDSDCPIKKFTGIICVDNNSAECQKNTKTSKCSLDKSSAGSYIESAKKAKRPILERSGITQYRTQYVKEERDLFHAFLYHVRKWDPDILIGYELQMLSWGYLIQRALVFDLDLGKLLSRVEGSSSDYNVDAEKDQWGAAHTHELKIGGRIILNVWRLMRHEVTLNVYTFENVAFHVLHERIPLFSFRTLSDWWDHRTDSYRWRTVDHYVIRCQGNVRLLEQVDFIGRTSELARLFGILFYSVISRGSQFRVESMMLRMSKPLNYLAISPSVQQRNSMNAPEVIPLVLEPESRFYSNPVLVLDFQSLYPSMIIAYNYCYSTCLGRVSCLEELGEFKFGASTLSVPPILIKKLKDDIHISPNGVAFVKSKVRLGVLPKMLEDILNTRIMVKNSMKKWKSKQSVHRMLDARQLGLKLIANVTYGYTAAHFSGRMPCVELGDSIVRKARETLEHAIHVVNTTSKWGARVVYGDTDSMFVLLDGCSKDEAFHIGRDIAQTITALNPKPVKLKFEKVYLPCVLQTKKRYVGYMYETPDQKEPVFDAKGIETVRRDTCPAVAKVLEKSLRLLFERKDVSLIKRYVQRQFRKVMEGRVSLQDLTFAKEYRGMASYKPGACVPALELTRRMLKEDRRSEPRVGERVPYVIVYGSPGLPLIKLVKRPHEVLQDPSLRINALYYISKQLIPPLNRALSLIGVDVSAWFAEVPRTSRVKVQPFNSSDTRKTTISHYFTTTNCPVCQQTTTSRLCDACANNPQKVVILNNQIRQYERRHRHLTEICYQCCGSRDTKLCCVSLDCPVFHRLFKASRDLEPSNHFRQLIATAIA